MIPRHFKVRTAGGEFAIGVYGEADLNDLELRLSQKLRTQVLGLTEVKNAGADYTEIFVDFRKGKRPKPSVIDDHLSGVVRYGQRR